MASDVDYRRLADAVRRRRLELGLNQDDIKALGGPSAATLRKIESGQQLEYRVGTTWPLERILGWQPGSIEGLLTRGVVPVEVGLPPDYRTVRAGNRLVSEATDVELLNELLQRAASRTSVDDSADEDKADPAEVADDEQLSPEQEEEARLYVERLRASGKLALAERMAESLAINSASDTARRSSSD